jgi:hypothetical protein
LTVDLIASSGSAFAIAVPSVADSTEAPTNAVATASDADARVLVMKSSSSVCGELVAGRVGVLAGASLSVIRSY